MGSILKYLRKIELINLIFRKILLLTYHTYSKIQPSWRISGIVYLQFNHLKFKYFSACDDGIVDTLYYNSRHPEEGELTLISTLSKSSTCIIDVGANTGLYSIIASKSNPNMKVIAIEPHPGNIARLKKNIQINNFTNIQVLENAVGDTEKIIHFNIPESLEISDTSSIDLNFSKQFYSDSLKWKEIPVSQISLDSLLPTIESETVDIVKIDVEGYEINVFEGAKQFIYTYQPIIICEIFINPTKKAYFDSYIKDLKYTAYLGLKDGLLRLDDGLIYNYDGWNYILAKGRTQNIFNSYKTLDKWLIELS